MLGYSDSDALMFGLMLNNLADYGEIPQLYALYPNPLVPLPTPPFPDDASIPLRDILFWATYYLSGVGQWLGSPEAPLNSWDELLMAYVNHEVWKPIYGLANSDSHNTDDFINCTIGSARNGAFVTLGKYGLTERELLKAIRAGHTFGTTGPSLTLDVNGKIMGDTAFICSGGTARINLYANSENPDVRLVKIDIIRNGEFWQTTYPGYPYGAEDYAITLEDADLTEDGYYRVEVTALDLTTGAYQFAWSNPIFVRVF